MIADCLFEVSNACASIKLLPGDNVACVFHELQLDPPLQASCHAPLFNLIFTELISISSEAVPDTVICCVLNICPLLGLKIVTIGSSKSGITTLKLYCPIKGSTPGFPLLSRAVA